LTATATGIAYTVTLLYIVQSHPRLPENVWLYHTLSS
jgi:hypothetical protein